MEDHEQLSLLPRASPTNGYRGACVWDMSAVLSLECSPTSIFKMTSSQGSNILFYFIAKSKRDHQNNSNREGSDVFINKGVSDRPTTWNQKTKVYWSYYHLHWLSVTPGTVFLLAVPSVSCLSLLAHC